ncbi:MULTISPECIES: hypothetical protein [unclassified Haloferax]|jgi:hypothetical protein|uniref:hypothetical protein n=1 Tax=unclassified Haloferax TaxID=2625095 RepID=UPI002874CFF8|nr:MULTISPECIES: hypothetical protein [unclassified Haloferax]MDS0243810.1 hypothetical protein [Haloferax sp. S2CR25]MDS0446931.1 hypothetical protein [Haloferax sp. S2CR25-2]
MDTMNTTATTRQYGAAIALVSGALLAALGDNRQRDGSSNSGLLMALLGVIVHGVALLTPYTSRLGNASGPLMIGYLLVMLLNQELVGVTGSMN